MKQFKLAALVLMSASLFSSAAFAHHDVMKDEVLPAATKPYDWNGFYAGINVGAVKHTLEMTDNQAASFNATIRQSANPQFTGGLQVGYRHKMDENRVSGLYGLELSADFSNATYSKNYGSPFALYNLNSKNELKNLGLLQFIGGVAADRTLLFLAAGLSWTNISGDTTTQDNVPFFNSFSVDKHVLGTAIGGGIEYAISEKISMRLKVDVITPNTYSTSDNTGNTYQIANTITQGTLGVNYKFG